MNFQDSTGRNAAWSLAQTIISAATVFVLYKYLYGTLGPKKLGLWAVVLASVSLGRLAELGFSTTVLRYVSMHLANGDKARSARILETGVISIGIPFAVALLVIFPAAHAGMQFVVPADTVASAREVLPFALATLWFGVIGSIAQSALDGCGRMDVKSKILVAGNFIYVPSAIAMVQHWEIVGLAICQMLQSAVVTILVWRAVRCELPDLAQFPRIWDKSCFREILTYAAGLQAGNLLTMLFEPATKILLSRYCGLNEVAHFEMANQVVSRVRALITSATQAYLPALSSNAGNISFARQIVVEATILTTGIGLPVMAALAVAFPVVSILWIGQIQFEFVVYGWILSIGWLISTLAIPLYYYCVGAGQIRTILLSQVIMVSLNALLGYAAAVFGNGHWVAASMMLALILSTYVIVRRSLIDLQVGSIRKNEDPGIQTSIRTILLIGAVIAVNLSISVSTSLEHYVYLNCLVHVTLLLLTAYMSEARTLIATRLRRAR